MQTLHLRLHARLYTGFIEVLYFVLNISSTAIFRPIIIHMNLIALGQEN